MRFFILYRLSYAGMNIQNIQGNVGFRIALKSYQASPPLSTIQFIFAILNMIIFLAVEKCRYACLAIEAHKLQEECSEINPPKIFLVQKIDNFPLLLCYGHSDGSHCAVLTEGGNCVICCYSSQNAFQHQKQLGRRSPCKAPWPCILVSLSGHKGSHIALWKPSNCHHHHFTLPSPQHGGF